MKQFYYQIKGRLKDGNWSWPPVASNLIEAADSKSARLMIEQEYGEKLPGGKLKGNPEYPYLLTIIDVTERPYLRSRFDPKTCKHCGIIYTLNDKYLMDQGGQQDFCSSGCAQDFKNNEGIEFNVNFDFSGIHPAVIYKITNKVTGLCYIGKTTQAFTLRWYQHFYRGCGTKFHAAIKEFGVDNWTFEVIEIIGDKYTAREKILERESYWIKHFDSINNGYNSVISKTEEEAEVFVPDLFIQLDEK